MDIHRLNGMLNESKTHIIREDLIHTIKEFIDLEESSSLENVATVLAGHSTIRKPKFNEKKLKAWCNNTGVEYYRDIAERTYTFRRKRIRNYHYCRDVGACELRLNFPTHCDGCDYLISK